MRKITGIVLLLLAATFILQDCTTSRIIYYQTSDPDDHKIFDTRVVHGDTGASVLHFAYSDKMKAKIDSVVLQPREWKEEGLRRLPPISLTDFLQRSKTNAFLIIRNDTILYEQYFNGYTATTVSNSFSMGKAVTSSLIGIALREGYIKSLQDPVTLYIPELRNKKGFEKIKIIHLLQMTSGIRFTENYLWFSDVAYLYYTKDRRSFFNSLVLQHEPGVKWQYKSIDAALLSLILSNATGRTVSRYAEDKLWKPLGMETSALWALDSKESGIEKTSCCLFATARDFARFGRLYAHRGKLYGQELISSDFFEKSIALDTTDGSIYEYQYQWWMPWWMGRVNDPFYAHGYKGQRLVISPSKNIIVVKLSDDPQADKANREYYMDLFRAVMDIL